MSISSFVLVGLSTDVPLRGSYLRKKRKPEEKGFRK